jgi:hypothetical protein
MSIKRGHPNPLGMYQLEPDGIWVLPAMKCSVHRKDFFQRANRIISTYSALLAYAEVGKNAMGQAVKENKIYAHTPIRLRMGSKTFQTNYKLLLGAFNKSAGQLVNQVFIMIYGNLEAYLIDVLINAFKEEAVTNAQQEAISLMYGTTWKGKIDRISQRFNVSIGKRQIRSAYKEIVLEVFGLETKDPLDLLMAMADVRHRLIHSAGRADSQFITRYPGAGINEGDLIQVPSGIPMDLHFFQVPLTGLIDEKFSSKYNWKRTMESPENLIDEDLRLSQVPR